MIINFNSPAAMPRGFNFKSPFLNIIEKRLRRRVEYINQRGKLMTKPISVSLPYPSLQGIGEDKKSAALLGSIYAGRHGELKAILQYVYHYFFFKKLGDEKTAQTVLGIAVSEMHHLDVLGELMLELGADPVFFSPTLFGCEGPIAGVSYSKTKEKMLIDDITGELVAINEYTKITETLNNERVEAVLKRIVIDEELHVKVLKERLSTCKVGF